jgi:hypothetical protein
MKVYENQGPILPTNHKKAHKNGAQEDAFQKIMDQMQAQVEAQQNEDATIEAMPQMQGVQIVQGIEKAGQATSAKEMVLNELRHTLDMVDIYAEKLGNTSLPVDALDPLIENLDERLQNLKNMESDKGLPDKLRPIVNDVVVTLGTEIAKSKRGDYS